MYNKILNKNYDVWWLLDVVVIAVMVGGRGKGTEVFVLRCDSSTRGSIFSISMCENVKINKYCLLYVACGVRSRIFWQHSRIHHHRFLSLLYVVAVAGLVLLLLVTCPFCMSSTTTKEEPGLLASTSWL